MFKHELIGDATTPKNFIVVEVEFGKTEVFQAMVDSFERETKRVARFSANGAELTIDFNRYLSTLLWLHIGNVNGSVPREYRFAIREIEVPAYFETVLAQIGIVIDKDFGIRFVPSFGINKDDLLSPSELLAASMEMMVLGDLGLRTVKGLPNPATSGSLGAMATNLVESGDVLSYRKDHPVYGFVAACFNFSHLQEMFGNALRIKYGSLTEFKIVAETILSASIGVDDDQP